MSQIISLEGNIGSGKSTLLELLKNFFSYNTNFIFLQEPIDEWKTITDKNNITILEKFYQNQEKYSFSFQMMAYISRLSLLKKTIEENQNAIIFTERCLDTDRYVFAKMLYDSGKMEDVEYSIYLRWFDYFLVNTKNTQKIIYLKTDPEVCFLRINKRSRDGENNISLDYLKRCHEYHENMIENSKFEKLIINSNMNLDSFTIDKWISNIRLFIAK